MISRGGRGEQEGREREGIFGGAACQSINVPNKSEATRARSRNIRAVTRAERVHISLPLDSWRARARVGAERSPGITRYREIESRLRRHNADDHVDPREFPHQRTIQRSLSLSLLQSGSASSPSARRRLNRLARAREINSSDTPVSPCTVSSRATPAAAQCQGRRDAA